MFCCRESLFEKGRGELRGVWKKWGAGRYQRGREGNAGHLQSWVFGGVGYGLCLCAKGEVEGKEEGLNVFYHCLGGGDEG